MDECNKQMGWKFTKDETPKTEEPVSILPEFKGNSFACWYEIPPVPEEMKNA